MRDPLASWLEQYGAYNPALPGHRVLLILTDSILLLTLMTIVFALMAIYLRLQYNRRERYWQNLNRKWDRDILDVLSGDQGVDDFLMLVENGQELDFIRFLAPYAYRLRGSDLDILSQLAQPHLLHVEKQLHHRSPGVRIWAVNIMGLFGMPAKEDSIAALLTDPSPAVAMFAASTLLSQQRVQFVVPVIGQLHRFNKWNIHALADLLVRSGPKAIPIMKNVYLDVRQSPRTRIVMAEALGRCNAFSALSSALLVLGSETNRDILVATMHLLAHISQGRHIEAIRSLCASSDEVLKITALRTLRSLAAKSDLPVFRKALEDNNSWVARQAALALRELGDMETLQKIAAQDSHPRCMLARQLLAEAP
jgi:hypothetical protein